MLHGMCVLWNNFLPGRVMNDDCSKIHAMFFLPGKILENLTLGPSKSDQSPPSQPPTPPSTPLSPKVNELNRYASGLPLIPNLTITQTSPNLPPNIGHASQQRAPLNLGKKSKQPILPYTNGTGISLAASSSLQFPDYSFAANDIDFAKICSKSSEHKDVKSSNGSGSSSSQNTRVSIDHIFRNVIDLTTITHVIRIHLEKDKILYQTNTLVPCSVLRFLHSFT